MTLTTMARADKVTKVGTVHIPIFLGETMIHTASNVFYVPGPSVPCQSSIGRPDEEKGKPNFGHALQQNLQSLFNRYGGRARRVIPFTNKLC
jgi:hypothetical protein